jgi:hypothetical protein
MDIVSFLYISLSSSTVQLHDSLGSDWNREGRISNFIEYQGTVGSKLMRELTLRLSNQSKKAEIVGHYCQWQILKPSGKRKAKRSCFERYWGQILGASLPTQIKACFNAMETSQFRMFVQKV